MAERKRTLGLKIAGPTELTLIRPDGSEHAVHPLWLRERLVMFDNCRLLHGRTAFDPADGLRHLQGCYIDIDGPRSLWRVLRRRRAQAGDARRSA